MTDLSLPGAAALSALFAHWTQTDRLLRLTTPLDAAVGPTTLLAETLHAVEGLGLQDLRCDLLHSNPSHSDAFRSAPSRTSAPLCGYRLELTALSLSAHVSLKQLIGQPVLLEMQTAHSRHDLRPFHGHVTACTLLGSNGGMARYRLVIEPWLAFLHYRRDSTTYQDMSVVDIVESVFADYRHQGKLNPAWRLDLADPSVYPKRSLTTQYEETDLAFIERLLLEEGLFTWFEHSSDAASPSLGSHTLVIADHNRAFTANVQPHIRFTQAGAVMKEDSIDRWQATRRWQTNAIEIASWDYRTLSHRNVSIPGHAGHSSDAMTLSSSDMPGVYAYEDRTQGERIALRQMQAIEARNKVFTAAGTVRTAAPGTTFVLHDHASHELSDSDEARTFVMLQITHVARNNLHAELKAAVAERLGEAPDAPGLRSQPGLSGEAMPGWHTPSVSADDNSPALYRNRIDAIRAAIPYRDASTDGHGMLLHPKPTVHGQQTAIVVGSGAPIHTDRDHRIKIQFHWQRGANSHSRQDHPYPDGHTGAPASDASGTWVRVAASLAPIAGANWGTVALPRVGQEVLVDFLDGDIDRPVVIGTLYNGRGESDSQANAAMQGAGAATGNAPAWFPGITGNHAHAAVFSGIKSQSLASSQSGAGGYSQLLFDDTPHQSRISLQQHASAHAGTAELNLGHLRHQADNQRMDTVGFGVELATVHSTAIRAGAGLLLSTHSQPEASGTQLDSREAYAQLQASHQLQTSLAATAQQHQAKLPEEADADKLPAIAALAHSADVLTATASGADGTMVTAYDEPHLQLASPAGIAATTPANAILVAGTTMSMTAGHDINVAVQGNLHHQARDGISLFTYGKATDPNKPNQETGMALHAASGKVSAQSQSGPTTLTADQTVTVASTTAGVTIGAAKHVLMTAGGAYLKLEGGNIELHAPGTIAFKASLKEFTGPKMASYSLPQLPKAGEMPHWIALNYVDAETANGIPQQPYEIHFKDGAVVRGELDAQGKARREDIPDNQVKKVIYLPRKADKDVTAPSLSKLLK